VALAANNVVRPVADDGTASGLHNFFQPFDHRRRRSVGILHNTRQVRTARRNDLNPQILGLGQGVPYRATRRPRRCAAVRTRRGTTGSRVREAFPNACWKDPQVPPRAG